MCDYLKHLSILNHCQQRPSIEQPKNLSSGTGNAVNEGNIAVTMTLAVTLSRCRGQHQQYL